MINLRGKSSSLEYLLFVTYLLIFAWLVTKIRFFTGSGLNNSQLIIVFLLKVLAGIFYGWIGLYYGGLAQMNDTWSLHEGSIQEYRLLFNNPREYFTNLFINPYEGGFLKFFESQNSYWNDLKGNILIKLFSIFNILSFGHYYVNVIYYSFLSLFGAIAIFRVMDDAFPGKRIIILLATFLVPSFLYWTSGMHKEGLIFTGISLIVYTVYFASKEKRWGAKRIISFILGLLLLFLLRNFLLVVVIPALLAWMISLRLPKYGMAVFGVVYLLFGVLFFSARHIHPHLDFPKAVVKKQQEFLQLKGGSSNLSVQKLEPHFISFLKNAPQAINHSAIRPYPSEVRHLLSLAASLEINIILFLFLCFIFWHRSGLRSKNLIYFCVFFSFSVLLTIGFSVNNLGAIVRYRSIVMPLLVVPIMASLDWSRFSKVFLNNIKIKNNT